MLKNFVMGKRGASAVLLVLSLCLGLMLSACGGGDDELNTKRVESIKASLDKLAKGSATKDITVTFGDVTASNGGKNGVIKGLTFKSAKDAASFNLVIDTIENSYDGDKITDHKLSALRMDVKDSDEVAVLTVGNLALEKVDYDQALMEAGLNEMITLADSANAAAGPEFVNKFMSAFEKFGSTMKAGKFTGNNIAGELTSDGEKINFSMDSFTQSDLNMYQSGPSEAYKLAFGFDGKPVFTMEKASIKSQQTPKFWYKLHEVKNFADFRDKVAADALRIKDVRLEKMVIDADGDKLTIDEVYYDVDLQKEWLAKINLVGLNVPLSALKNDPEMGELFQDLKNDLVFNGGIDFKMLPVAGKPISVTLNSINLSEKTLGKMDLMLDCEINEAVLGQASNNPMALMGGTAIKGGKLVLEDKGFSSLIFKAQGDEAAMRDMMAQQAAGLGMQMPPLKNLADGLAEFIRKQGGLEVDMKPNGAVSLQKVMADPSSLNISVKNY